MLLNTPDVKLAPHLAALDSYNHWAVHNINKK